MSDILEVFIDRDITLEDSIQTLEVTKEEVIVVTEAPSVELIVEKPVTEIIEVGYIDFPDTLPNGTTELIWEDSLLKRINYPDGSYVLMTWDSNSVLISANYVNPNGKYKNLEFTWLNGNLQNINSESN